MASGLPASINGVISSPLYATLIGGTILAIAGAIWQSIFLRRRFGWSVRYDQPINQGALAPVPPSQERGESGESSPPPDEWVIVYKKEASQDAPTREVRNGSLVVLRIRNIGLRTIRPVDYGATHFMLRFPGRKVVHYKVRGNAAVHNQVHRSGSHVPSVKPGEDNYFYLPALQLNPGDRFELLVLLESETDGHPEEGYPKPEFVGTIQGGGFVPFGRYRRFRRTRRVAFAALGVLVLALGGWAGASIANSAQDPAPVCGSGSLTIAGSTAFAPVFTQVVNEYEQHCADANITINPDGSIQGLTDLQKGNATIAMYDGTPQGEIPSQYHFQKVGDVIFAVVGNTSLPRAYFESGKGGGLTSAQIANAFNDPEAGGFAPVGRALTSGTRQTFVNDVLPEGDTDSAEKNAGHCPIVLGASAGKVCLEDTTLELLDYVNGTPHAIGYAEADALPFFPNVREIPIGGYQPSRANVLNGRYRFLATEHLYTHGQPSGLAKDLIDFLNSPQITAQLRATSSFIACSDLAGTARGDDCLGN